MFIIQIPPDVNKNITLEDRLVRNLDMMEKQIHRKVIKTLLILLKCNCLRKRTWNTKDKMKLDYP